MDANDERLEAIRSVRSSVVFFLKQLERMEDRVVIDDPGVYWDADWREFRGATHDMGNALKRFMARGDTWRKDGR